MSRFIWTEERFKILEQNYGHKPIKEIAEELGTTYAKVVDKASKSGLNAKKISGEMWTEEEDSLLRKHFEYAPKNYITNLFPNRSWPAIFQRGNKILKLRRISQDKYSINYRFFDDWNELSGYIFGFTLADGYLALRKGQRKANMLQFEIANYDRDILDKIKSAIEFEGPVRESKRNTVKLDISNTKILTEMIKKGIPESNKTLEAAFPNCPTDIHRHIIRGLFDGDGSIYDDHGLRFQLLGTQKLLETVLKILPVDTEGIEPYDRNKDGANVFVIKFGKKKSKIIFDWLYKDTTIYLDRKYSKYQELVAELKPCELLGHQDGQSAAMPI